MKFPNDSILFIPDNHWYGGPRRAGCYKEEHTRLVLHMYESENLGHLNHDQLPEPTKKTVTMVHTHDTRKNT
jgi:hypothetical protein